ncbi:mechanosensitive channel of small conductance (MscS1E) [Vairimorpha necatrix]|uniref:Mechanosensitive channel of small conductance (MscS1E) n=1 Tax=Vairimorpha necatrix TaxID=6039 RepID=A0AAX4J9L3_9MICR
MSNLEYEESDEIEELEDINSLKYSLEDSENSEDEFDYDAEQKDFKSTILKLKDKAEDNLSLRYYIIFICTFTCLILSLIFWKDKIEVKEKNGDIFFISLGLIFLNLFLSSVVFLVLNFIIFCLPFYYVTELSEHISLSFVCLFYIIYFYTKKFNVCIKYNQGVELYLGDILNIILISVFLFAGLRVWSLSIGINFNYSIYIERIRKCIAEDVFLSIFKRKNNPKKIKYLINKYLVDDHMDLNKRRSLFKEFQKSYKNSQKGKKKEKYKESALKKANSLYFRALTNYKINYTGDINFLINQYIDKEKDLIKTVENQEKEGVSILVDRFIKLLNLPSKYRLDGKGFYRIIKRVDREKYIITKNLEQMSAALDRVCLFIKFLIILVALMLYIKVFEELASTAGIISAIFGTQIISNSFSTNAISSLIFLFIIHPYDIGDRILVNLDNHIENLVVSELNVFSTVFLRWNGTCVYVPNSLLSTKLITNIRRSGIIADSHKIQINSRTDQSKLLNLKTTIEAFLKKHKEDYTEYCMVNYESIENSNKLHMKVYMQYKTNSQNYELYLKRKTSFLSFLNRTLQVLEIEYNLPIQRVTVKNESGKNQVG